MTKSKERVVGPICIGHVYVHVSADGTVKLDVVHDKDCPEWCR